MAGAVLVSVLKAVLLLGCVLMALKLYRTGLYRRFPIFFAFFIFRIPNSIWPLFLEVSSPRYQQVWVLTEPFEFGFYVLMEEDLNKLVHRESKGLFVWGRRALYDSLSISLTFPAISRMPGITLSVPQRS